MHCDRCNNSIPKGEQEELHGQILCEDCYMDLLSPPKTCDPWAVHSAKTFMKNSNGDINLSPIQLKILELLQNKGPQTPEDLREKLKIREMDLERNIAALRHMEQIRGKLKDGKKLICLW